MTEPKYDVGQLIEHTLFGYRGVIVSVDPKFNHSEAWYQSVAKTKPPKDKPWYHVLVDETDYVTYVAERNLRNSLDVRQVDHPLLGNYFNRFNGSRYLMRGTRH